MRPEKPGTLSSLLSLVVIFSPLLTFFTLYLLPITLLAHSAWRQTLHERGRDVENSRNGRPGECIIGIHLSSAVRTGMTELVLMGMLSLFCIHLQKNTHNPTFPWSRSLFLPCVSFLCFSRSGLDVLFFISGSLRGLLHRWVPDLQHLSLISCHRRWSERHSLYKCKNSHFYSPGC